MKKHSPVRTRSAVKKVFPQGIEKLELGSGMHPEPGHVHLDIQVSKDVDILADVRKIPIPDNFVTKEVRAVHIMEHFCHPEFASASMKKSIGTTMEVLKEAYRVMAPGAKFYMVTPDFEKIAESAAKKRVPAQWLQRWTVGGHQNIFDVHHWLWRKADAELWFKEAGFINLLDSNPIQGWQAVRSLNWTPPEKGNNSEWHKTEWYHWLFFEGIKP